MANLTPVGVQAVVEGMSGFMGNLDKMGSGITGLGSAVIKVGEIAAGAAVAGVAAFTAAIGGLAAVSKIGLDSLVGWGEQLDRLGDQFGMTGEEASKWTVAMNRVGLSVEEGGQGLNYFTKNMDDVKSSIAEADGKVSPFQKALDALGINAYDASGSIRSLDSIMPEIMDKFQAMPAGVNSTALAMDLFGARGGTKFLDFLRQGSQGLSDSEAMAKAFGLEMSTDSMNAIESYGFALNELNLGLTGIKNQIGMAVLPYARQFVEWAKSAVPTIVNLAKILGDKLGKGLQIITDLFGAFQTGGLAGLFSALGPAIDSAISGLMPILLSVVDTIAGALRDNWPAIQAVLLGWASRFWDWLMIAIPIGQANLALLWNTITSQIAIAWPGIQAQLLIWGTRFWDWLTNVALPVVGMYIGQIVMAIVSALIEAWPSIQAQLLTWGTQFWDWVTAAIPIGQAQLFLLLNTIQSQIAMAWPGIQAALMAWATQFWSWLTGSGGAIDQVGANLGTLANAMQAWVSGPGATQLQSAGEMIGQGIVTGLKGIIGGELAATDVLTSLGAKLMAIAPTLASTWVSAGVNIGTGLATGIIEGITGTILSEDTRAQIQTALTGITEGLNPFAPVARGAQDLSGALSGLSLPAWLRPGSPTPLETGLLGIANALDGKVTKALEGFSAIATPAFNSVASAVTQIKTDLAEMADTTLVAFSAAMDAAGAVIVGSFEEGNAAANDLVGSIQDMRNSLSSIAGYAQSAGNSLNNFSQAGDGIYNMLIPALNALIAKLGEVESAADDAAGAVESVGSGAPAANAGPGAQFGANFVVPGGFPRDTFPFRASTGERVVVIPKAQTAAGGGTNVTVSFGDVAINNGMDLAELGMFVERSVVQALGA